MLEDPAGEVEDLAGGFSGEPGEGGGAGGGLVLPEEVVAALAGQLAERARCGEPVTLTGPGGLLTGVIGQVLAAGLAAELGWSRPWKTARVRTTGGTGRPSRR